MYCHTARVPALAVLMYLHLGLGVDFASESAFSPQLLKRWLKHLLSEARLIPQAEGLLLLTASPLFSSAAESPALTLTACPCGSQLHRVVHGPVSLRGCCLGWRKTSHVSYCPLCLSIEMVST